MVKRATKTEEILAQTEETSTGLAKALSEGAADAYTAASKAVPALGSALRRTVYGSCYYLTYGVVFTSLVIGDLIPMNNAMGEGIHDGAEAARQAFREHQASAPASPTPA